MNINYKPKTELEKFGLKVYALLVDNFPRTFFVGGMVRDLLLRRKITDIDIATIAKARQAAEILKNYFIDFNLGYQNLGVALAAQKRMAVAITTFRKDLPGLGRYPKIKFLKTAKEDSQRRDFTINALYLSPKTGKILDFHKGLEDLKKKRIKFIGSAEKRIKQDPLRIIRALRFALILDFAIEKQSYKAIKNNWGLLANLTQARTGKEINKIKNKTQRKILETVVGSPKTLDKYFKSR